MASGAKRQRYSVAEALDIIFDDGSEHGGMSSGEESELDRKLENPSEESRWSLSFIIWKSMLTKKKKCLRLFLLSNILLFRYQIILILKIIASYYEKFTPDCFVNLNV
nr:uncharacterized protein LOC131785097 isoform X2 [Pocillopora verrucosa]